MKLSSQKAGIFLLSAFLFSTSVFSQNNDVSINRNIRQPQDLSSSDDTQDETTEPPENPKVSLPHLYTYINSGIVEQRQSYTREEIERTNAESITSFFQAAGIQILSYGAYGLESKPSVRGFTDETVRVVIDGICVNNAQYGTFDFSTINTADIEKIEIVKGGFTEQVSDEGAVGGVIYITTKKQTLGHHFSADSSVKSFFNKNSPFDTFCQKFGYSGQISENTFLKTNIKGTAAQNKYPFINYKNKTSVREHSSVYDGKSDIKLSHFFGNGNNWNIGNSTYAARKEIPGPETSLTTGIQKDFDNNLSFNISFPSINQSLKLDGNAAWLSNTRFYEEQTESRHYVNSFILSSAADFYKYERFQQAAGITLNVTHLNSTDDGIHTLFSGTFKETSRFFLNDIFSVTVPLSIKFSGKNIAFIPKLGIRASFKYADIMLNGYRMVQFPNMDDLYWGDSSYACGNPDLTPEYGWGAECTVNAHNIFIPFSICIFTNYYTNKIQWSSNSSGKWTPQNVASAFYLGIDVSFEKTFFSVLTVKGNVEYLHNQLLDKSNKLTYGNRIMWTPDFVGSLIVSLNAKYVFISVESNYVGKKYISNLNTSYTEPYFLLNSSMEFQFWEHIKPYIRIENILDADYEAVPDYPMPGISASAGIKCTF